MRSAESVCTASYIYWHIHFKLLSRKVLFINRKDNRNCWKVDYLFFKKEISRENYSKIVGTRNFQRTFERRKRSFLSAFSICMTITIKHVKLIIFENYNECKTKHLFLIKKVVTRFDKKITTCYFFIKKRALMKRRIYYCVP